MEGDPSKVSRTTCYLLFGLAAYAAWARGGVYPDWQWPLATLSVLIWGWLLAVRSRRDVSIAGRLLRDPVVYVGGIFLLLVVSQWTNSNHLVVWDEKHTVDMARWPSRWAPWSVEPRSSGQMLNWFLPAWTGLVMVRHALDRSSLRHLLHLLTWNAALLAAVALLQDAAGADKMLGIWEVSSTHFLGTFDYINHGGAWFYLHAALAAGLLHHAVRHRHPSARIMVWTACFLLCLSAAFASQSRAAGVAGLILVVAAIGGLVQWARKRSAGTQMVNVFGLTCIILLAGAVLYFGSGEGALAEEINHSILGEGFEQTVEARAMQLPSAWEISKDYPLFGCGGWGYRWVALLHIPVEEWAQWRGAGKANVHCDPLQFLVEFGWIGSLLMAAVIGIILADVVRRRRIGAMGGWIGLGLLLVFIHSFVDLPFRSPAILITWCMLLAAIPRLEERESTGWSEEEEP